MNENSEASRENLYQRLTAPIHNEPLMIIHSPINNLAELRPGNMTIDAAIHSCFLINQLINRYSNKTGWAVPSPAGPNGERGRSSEPCYSGGRAMLHALHHGVKADKIEARVVLKKFALTETIPRISWYWMHTPATLCRSPLHGRSPPATFCKLRRW
jgi:hypothetical protein